MAERADAPWQPGGAALRAEFYLCLARAFLAPMQRSHLALTRHLADDLGQLAGQAGYPIAGLVAQLRAASAGYAAHLDLMRLYAALFLVPPTPVRINAGHYLDGMVMGGSVRAIEACYSRLGVARSAGFRDTSDHVAVQLEFLALLFGRQAQRCPAPLTPQDFLEAFVRHWVRPFRADLERASAALGRPNPYLHLAQMLEQAAGADAAVAGWLRDNRSACDSTTFSTPRASARAGSARA